MLGPNAWQGCIRVFRLVIPNSPEAEPGVCGASVCADRWEGKYAVSPIDDALISARLLSQYDTLTKGPSVRAPVPTQAISHASSHARARCMMKNFEPEN